MLNRSVDGRLGHDDIDTMSKRPIAGCLIERSSPLFELKLESTNLYFGDLKTLAQHVSAVARHSNQLCIKKFLKRFAERSPGHTAVLFKELLGSYLLLLQQGQQPAAGSLLQDLCNRLGHLSWPTV